MTLRERAELLLRDLGRCCGLQPERMEVVIDALENEPRLAAKAKAEENHDRGLLGNFHEGMKRGD